MEVQRPCLRPSFGRRRGKGDHNGRPYSLFTFMFKGEPDDEAGSMLSIRNEFHGAIMVFGNLISANLQPV